MKTIRDTLANLMPPRHVRLFRWLKPALAVLVGMAACAAGAAVPANDNFANRTVLTSIAGSTNGDNTLATLEYGETNMVFAADLGVFEGVTNSVWFAWTATTSGTLQVSTLGSNPINDYVVSIWASTNSAPTMGDGSLTNLVSDDDSLTDTNLNPYSAASIRVVAGATYYIEVSSFDDGSSDNAGAYVLNWTATTPAVPSGAFQFTANTFTVSQSDSAAPVEPFDAHTVDPSVSGARVTVTRPGPAYGRVLVDYTVADGIYTNTFVTNYFGTNVITMFQTTDLPPIITFSNSFSTNIVIYKNYQSYARGYQIATVSSAFTNSATTIENLAYINIATNTGTLSLASFTNLPYLTNYHIVNNNGGTFITNGFGYLQNGPLALGIAFTNGAIVTNGSVVFTNFAVISTNFLVTNFFGANISLIYTPGTSFNYTNFHSTNIVVGQAYYTNTIYTNGSQTFSLASFGTNWPANGISNVITSILNATNYQNNISPLVAETPVPLRTDIPPLGGSTPSPSITIDPTGLIILSATNTFSYQSIGTFFVPSANGITTGTGTVIFTNLQMSSDIMIPVNEALGPDAPDVEFIPGFAQLTLSNPRVDPQEDPNVLVAPLVANPTAVLNALSPEYGAGFFPSYNLEKGSFSLERSTFRVDKNVGGTNAIISVYRAGTNSSDSVSVDYVIDPPRTHGWPYGFNPASGNPATTEDTIVTLQDYSDNQPNTFTLQAGSDYALPNSDYGPVTGTLNWGAFDYTPQQIVIPILDNGLIENNVDFLVQLHNPLPLPAFPAVPGQGSGMTLGEINSANVTILFNDTLTLGSVFPGQQPAGAVDRSWNKDNAADSPNPFQQIPGTTPGFGGTVYAVAEVPDGTAFIAGSFISYNGAKYNRIVKVLPNGYQDPTFQGNFAPWNNSGANDFISSMVLQPDGRVIIGGNFNSYNGSDRHHIARLNSDGSVDSSFNPKGGADDTIWSLALQPNGQILIGGAFSSFNGATVNQLARLNSDGSLDTNFVVGVLGGTNVVVDAIAVDAANRVLIGGNFDTVAGVNCGAVARLKVDGSLDTTFTPGIGTYNPETSATDPVKAIAVQADGRILIGGSFANFNLVTKNGLARLNSDGTLDLSLQSGTGTLDPATGEADSVDAILLQPDGKILIGGDFLAYNQTRRVGLARVFLDGSLDTSFMDATYNQFAGVPTFYLNANVVSTDYPFYNTRSAVYTLALESNAFTTSSNLLIGGSFEMVGGGYSRDDMRPRSNVARVIGGATPGPGNIELMYNNYSANNNDKTLYVALTRTNGNLGPASATLSVTTAAPGPGVATAGTDFSPSSFNPLWISTWSQFPNVAWDNFSGEYGPNFAEIPQLNPRNTQADVTINVFNPGNISGDLGANLGLLDPVGSLSLGGEAIPNGVALGAGMSAPMTIIDSNVKSGVLGFSSPTYSVIQNASTATITVTRTNGSDGEVTVNWITSDGTGVNGVDYIGGGGILDFKPSITNLTFTVRTRNNVTQQPDKTVNLQLYTPGGGATLGLSNAVLTLINKVYSSGHIGFSATNYSVSENGGSVAVTVNRLGGSAGALGVRLYSADVTAVSGGNYTGINTNHIWTDGVITPWTVTIPVRSDGFVKPDLIADLILTNSTINGTNNSGPLSFGNSASPTNATLTIVNVDSAGSFQFSMPAYSVKKYAGYALVPVIRTGGSVGAVQVSFTTADHTAVQGTDYTFVTNTLVFKNGVVSRLVTVPVFDNGTNNPPGPRDLFLKLSNPTGLATIGSPNPATLNIIDSAVKEDPGTGDSPYTFGFNGAVYSLTLQPNNQLLAGGDFTMADGVLRNHIARLNSDGSLDAGFSLPTDTDGANDSVRTIAVQADGRILVGGFFTNFNSTARGHIARLNSDGTLDSLFNPGSGADNPVYATAETFVSGVSKVLIGGAFATVGGTTFNGIGRLNSDGTPDSGFNIGGQGANNTVYALAVQGDGKILIGGDFTTYDGQVNFNHLARLNPDGSADTNFNVSASGPSDSVRAIAVQLDGKILIGGLFTNVNGVALNHVARLNANGTVDAGFAPGVGADDAVFAIGLQSDTRIVLGGEFTSCSGVTRNRITRLNPDGSVDPSINFGTGADNFVAAIAIQQDTFEGYPTNVPDEKIIIGGGFTTYNGGSSPYLSRIYGGSIGGSGAIEFSSANYQVDEQGTNVLITVIRTGGTTNAPTGDIIVNAYTTSDGTAAPGINYVAVSTNLDFPLGEVVKTFTIPVMDDGVVTPNLTVNLAVTNPTAPAEIGNKPTAILTIINDDSSVCFSNVNYSVSKSTVTGVAPINILRIGGTNNTTTVHFMTTAGGTAVPVTDYTPLTQTVTFNPGVSVVPVNIQINNNGLPEGDRTVTMQLTDATGSTLIAPTNATLTIRDTANAPGNLSFASPTYTVTEGGGVGFTTLLVTVQRTDGTLGSLTVGFATKDGTAAAGSKYIATNGVLSFTGGEVSKTFPIAILNTTTAEGPETFSINLYTNTATGSTGLVLPTNTVVTILNTNTGIAFASAANSYTEPSGPVTGTVLLNVIRFNNTSGTTTVNYSTTNGTAVAGTDFVGVNNGTLTFNPGDSVKTIAITTMHNPSVTGDLSFTVGLANPSGSAQLTPPSYTVVTDHDADAGISLLTNAVSVYRNAGFVVIPVLCSNPNVEPISVNYSTGGGTAVAGVDYTATSGTLSFTNGAAFNFFIVPILLNNSVQSNRTFNVTLSGPTPPGVLLPPSTEVVTIIGTNTPPGLSFSTPIIISGLWGTTNANNVMGAAEAFDPTIAGYSADAPVWFEWTAPPGVSGEVALDTIGSLNTNGYKLDTVLAVFTGANLNGLNQVAANDDLSPSFQPQFNYIAQNIFNTNTVISSNTFTFNGITQTFFTTNTGIYDFVNTSITQPFGGPSGLRFNATGGTTYYIAADTKSTFSYTISNGTIVPIVNGRGTIQLSWAYHPSGVLRFATENVDQTGIFGTNGNPMLLYQCAESEGGGFNGGFNGGHRVVWNGSDAELETTLHAYYYYDVSGLLVTVTRVAGSSGRIMVNYHTVDGDTNIIKNGDVPALAGVDYTSVSNTLVFNDFEMSKTIRIPIFDDGRQPQPNRDFMVVLSNPQRDPSELGSVSAPRVDPIFGQVLCRILDCDIDPKGPTSIESLVTNVSFLGVTNIFTNNIIADQAGALFEPTNGLFNFSKANYRIARDYEDHWPGTPATVFVNRAGTNRASVTLHYRFDNFFLDKITVEDRNNEFPLQPGSDYATPTPANGNGVFGTNSDFAGVGGDSGTLTFPGGTGNDAFNSQPIHFNIQNNHLTGFNKDIHITTYEEDSNGDPRQDGMVAETTITILFDDLVPPAGSVDEFYNPDFATDLMFETNALNLNTKVFQPGTDPQGEVYSVALAYQGARVVTHDTNNQTIIGGAFATYTDSTNTYSVNGVARLLFDGSLDPTFNLVSGNIGSGINVFPADEFVRSVALTPDHKVLIGGDFTSFDNIRRNGVARLNSDGTLDSTFNPGAGANGEVWSVLAQADGKVIIGGEFTTYNGAPASHVARLNPNGSLDRTFNSSNLITGPVYTMALSPQTPFNFSHASDGTTNEDDQVINLCLQTSGNLSYLFNSPAGTNQFQIYYGDTNVAAGTGVLLYDTGTSFTNFTAGSLQFGPVGGFVTNILTVVVNQNGQSMGYTPWNYALFMAGQTNLMLGGDFKVAGQFIANIARLNPDGSLDGSFNPGTGPNGPVLSLGWQPDGKVIVGGSFHSISGVAFNNLARLNADGSIDPAFENGTGADSSVNSITLQPVSGLVYAGGPFTMMNGTHRLGFTRLYPNGTVDTTFLDTAYNQFAGLPRLLFADAPGAVYSSALQSDGNIIIGGSFQEVGGGQADYLARYVLEADRGLQPSTADANLLVSESGLGLEPKTRDGVRNRSNLARLIGGATGGPGNIGMLSSSFAVNKTQLAEPVNLVRVNGSLGYASANFSVLPGLANSGADYSYSGTAPLYPVDWEYSGPSRMHSDGLFGSDGAMQDIYGRVIKYGINGPATVIVAILNNASTLGNLNAQFQMANPSQADQFYLGGQNIPLGVALGISQAPLTLIDNTHVDGVFGFASPSYAATNTPLSVAIARVNGTFGQAQIYYRTVTNGSTAVLNVDYRATNGYVTFNQGDVSKSFQITILSDSSVTSQEKDLNVQLSNGDNGGRAKLGLTNAVVRIINPNFPGYLSLSSNAYYGSLSSGFVSFTVTRTVGSKGTLTLQYATANGTAVNGLDYAGATNTLTWDSGDVSPKTVTIPLVNHGLIGPNKLFAASLFNATLNGSSTPSLMGSITNAILAIVNDNNYGTFQFSSPSYQFNDSGSYATITVTRGGSALGTSSVNYSTLDGSAVAGANYVATNNTLTFLPGQLARSFNVQLLDDGKTNDPAPASFYFSVVLNNPAVGSSLGSPTKSLVHLVHGEQYNQPPGSIDPSFVGNVNATVLGLALQSDGQVVAGGTFTVADDTTMNRIARFNLDGTLDNNFLEGMAGADGPVNAVLSQTDDRIVVGGSFANINSIARQGVARLMLNGTLDTSFNPGAGADNTVYALAESFVNGGRAIYVGGAFSTYNTVPSPCLVRLDNSGGVDGSFAVGGGAIGTVYALAVYPSNAVNNAGKVLVGGAFTNFNGSLVGNLVRLNPDGSLDTNFNQHVSVNGAVRAIAIQLDGDILVGGDFTNVNATVAVNHLARLNADGTLDGTFTAAAAPAVNGTVSAIAVQLDNRIVVGGQFSSANGVTRNNITRLLPTGAVDPSIDFGAGANGNINAVVIQPSDGDLVLGGAFTTFDNQPHGGIVRLFGGSETGSGVFQFTSASYQIDELGGVATISIKRTGGTSGTNADGSGHVFVAFTTADGTAVAGVNYTFTTNYVDFPAGEVLKNVFVPVRDDGVITADLTVDLKLSNPSPGTGRGDQANAKLTIINDDNTVQFQGPTYSVPKDTVLGVANIEIVRVGSTSGSATVTFTTTTNGTAVVGTDYYPTNGLITFNPGDLSTTVQIPIIKNALPEGNKTVTMLLTNAFNTVLGSPSNAVLTIVDTSTNIGSLFFAQTNFTANASDGIAYLTVERTNGTHGDFTAAYTIVPGTATPDLISPTNGTVTVLDGHNSATIGIQLADNSLQPVSCSIFLSLPPPVPPGASLVAPTNATLTIINNTAVFAFTQATNFVPENTVGPASIVVQRFNNASIVSTVNFATTNGTAVAGVNYSNTFGTLTFGIGEMFKAIAVPLFNRSNLTDLTFGVNLSSPVNGRLIAPSNTVVVLQASAAGVSFTTNSATVLKSAGFLPVTVICSNPRVEPVLSSNPPPLQVSYMTVDGTAKAGFDYNATTGTLIFTNGIGTNTFNVPILNNPSFSTNLTFSIILTNVTAPGRIAPYGTQAVVIAESFSGLHFSQSGYSVYKTGGFANIRVDRTGFTNDTVSVDFSVTNGTAISGQNYYPTNGTLVFTNGVTSQTFGVPIIAYSQVQPNLFALLRLSNPSTNAHVINPGVATLTILENGGAYVVPAGAQLVADSTSAANLANNVIGSNDTVQVQFAFRDAAGLNVTNLIAYLQPTNGVTVPSGSQAYGPLTAYGHSVSRPFTFTAHGTNGLPIAPTFQLYDGAKYIGPGTLVFTVGTWTTTFANSNMIVIRDKAAASPYPSVINVTNVGNTLIKATVTVTNLSHQNFSDIDALVVSPTTNTLIFGHVGAGNHPAHVTLIFDDAATGSLPQNGTIATGTNKPSQYGIIPNFP